jgi:hypothetical protein
VKKLLLPVAIGFVFAAWTVVVLYRPDYVPREIGLAFFWFIFPGLFLGAVVGYNVHEPRIWVAIISNFFIYSWLAHIAAVRWQNHKIGAKAKSQPNSTPKNF